MTDRLSDIGARIAGVHQLAAVVNAMRGIAAARVQQARAQLEAIDAYAATIGIAIGRALALSTEYKAEANPSGRQALVLFCAEQGFAGAFSERVLDAIDGEWADRELFLIGSRGAIVAAERGIGVGWKHAMPSHSPGIPKFADAIVEALYGRLATGDIGALDAVFGQMRPGHGTHIERRRLFPFDMTRFPPSTDRNPPLVNLPVPMLLSGLTADYVHAQLCNAALHSFAAENQARMEAMEAARTQIERQLASLRATQRMVRQEQITDEIIELAAGETASRRSRISRGRVPSTKAGF